MKTFIHYLQSKNLSESTQNHYLLYVERFINWYDKDLTNCTQKDVIKYLSHLKNDRNQQNITRRNNLIALNHYFTFLQQNNQIADNPTALLKIRGTKKKTLYNVFTFEQLQQLNDDFYNVYVRNFDDRYIPKNQRQKSRLTRQRNHIILNLLTYQGLITSELQRIKTNDIDLIHATINIIGGKKSNARKIPLQPDQIGVLIHYIQNIRPQYLKYQIRPTGQLFLPLSEVSRKTTRSNQLNIIKPLTRQVKQLSQKFTGFKQIRASIITHWIKTYGLRKAQYFAGHRYISSTENYLPNDLESLTDEMTKYNPF